MTLRSKADRKERSPSKVDACMNRAAHEHAEKQHGRGKVVVQISHEE